jgi:hypothetical protein
VRATVRPQSGDDRARIQQAIDAVSKRAPDANGFRGAVLLEKGTYQVDGTLYIRKSGVVLRGRGQCKSCTTLVATRRKKHDLIRVEGKGEGVAQVGKTKRTITSSYVPVGSRKLQLDGQGKALPFRVGDSIAVVRTPNQRWIDELSMGRWGWKPSSYVITHERTVTAVKGNTLWVDIPFVDTIERKYGGGHVYLASVAGRIERCGVEDLRLVSEHASSRDENHAWNGVVLSRVKDGWVRRVSVVHFAYSAVTVDRTSAFNTVEEVAMLDPVSQITGGRRYSFNVGHRGAIGTLFQRCYSRGGRHNFVTSARVAGPNVWLDSVAEKNYSDDGPHHRWSTGLLFDNTKGDELNVKNRESSGTGHGWAGAQTMFWNCRYRSMICDAPRGAMNWVVGSTGRKLASSRSPYEAFGWWESHDKPVKPRSLYLQQLQDRRGAKAVAAVTIPAQRGSSIDRAISLWAGKDRLAKTNLCASGVRGGNICCAASCGKCGGSGCSGRPGGASKCCAGSIRDAQRSCAEFEPPCLIPDGFETPEPKPVDPCADGILNGNACCAASCGKCGGSGCGGRPGGAQSCCTGAIRDANRSCDRYPPPCVVH